MTPRPGLLRSIALSLICVWAGPVSAQRLAPAAPAPVPPPAAADVSHSQAVSVPAGTGMLLRLPQPAATVMSADPGVARVQPASPTSLFLMGVAPGRTTVVATSETGAAIVQYDVNVTSAGGAAAAAPLPAIGGGGAGAEVSATTANSLTSAIRRMVPGALSVRAQAAGGRMVLQGTVPSAAAAQQAEAIAQGFVGERTVIVSELTVLGSIQVNVRVRIAEIDRTITRQLGFNWQALGANGNNWRFGLLTGAATGGAISPLLPLGLTPFLSAPAVPNQVGAGFQSGNGNWDVNAVIDALAADQLITVLAEPNLTAESGETASFLAGGEYPIPVSGTSSNGQANITIEYKQYGVSLAVIPTVLSPTRLNLRVRPEVSQLTNAGAISVPIQGGTLTIPALTVRRAETTVELGSGQSFAIAGLLQKTSADVTSALPGLGELPVIGALFKSNDFQRGQSELVIIVTPYLVKPAPTPQALRAPTDGFRPATDLDRVLLGRQLAPAPGAAPLDAGFILK
jgi:pilus assembly protein CpaC